MFLWMREIAGWILVAIALFQIRVALNYVSNRQVVEAAVVGFILLALLRAGVLLIRMSTAARIALKDAQADR